MPTRNPDAKDAFRQSVALSSLASCDSGIPHHQEASK